MDIAGHWRGHYIQNELGKSNPTPEELVEMTFPVEAWFEQDGRVLTGRMLDERPVNEARYSDVFKAKTGMMGVLDQVNAMRYVAKHPDCIYRVSLFPESTVKGQVIGESVLFFKTHAGPSDYSYDDGDVEQITRYKSVEFHYQGRVKEDGNLIVGTYCWPNWKGPQGTPAFELRRVAEDEAVVELEEEIRASEEPSGPEENLQEAVG